MQCRDHCGACCIAPSISSAIPGMPNGKLSGEACIHLSELHRCNIFDDPVRPSVCANLKPALDICGENRAEALDLINILELSTAP